MNNLKKFFYGILIGISNLIPGFSGGTMILILGIYEEFTGAIALFTKKPWQSIKLLWSVALGMMLGIIIATFTVALCLKTWPLITSSFFVGLVIASIPLTMKHIGRRKPTVGAIISFITCAVVSLVLPFAGKLGLNVNINNPNIFVMIFVLIVSGCAAATMIIPAASGSLILLAFGMFEPIILILEDCMKGVLNLDFTPIWNNLYILIPFVLGCILGIILIAKIITLCFKHHDLIIWYGILGLLVTSIFTIYYNAYDTHIAPNMNLLTDHLALNIILSIVMFLVGLVGLNLIMKVASKKENKDNIKENESLEEESKKIA